MAAWRVGQKKAEVCWAWPLPLKPVGWLGRRGGGGAFFLISLTTLECFPSFFTTPTRSFPSRLIKHRWSTTQQPGAQHHPPGLQASQEPRGQPLGSHSGKGASWLQEVDPHQTTASSTPQL